MKSIFLSHERVFENPLRALKVLGAAAPASDLARLTAVDDGFLLDDTGGINYYLAGNDCVDRFGRSGPCGTCAVRPAILLEEGDENLLRHVEEKGSITTAEYGLYPTAVLDRGLREHAEKTLKDGKLQETGRSVTVAGEKLPVCLLSSREVILLQLRNGGANGYVRLSDGTVVSEGDHVFLEMKPVRWIYDRENALLLSAMALFAGLDREAADAYLKTGFLEDLQAPDLPAVKKDAPFRCEQHDELNLFWI